jgi:hypothetical protein
VQPRFAGALNRLGRGALLDLLLQQVIAGFQRGSALRNLLFEGAIGFRQGGFGFLPFTHLPLQIADDGAELRWTGNFYGLGDERPQADRGDDRGDGGNRLDAGIGPVIRVPDRPHRKQMRGAAEKDE